MPNGAAVPTPLERTRAADLRTGLRVARAHPPPAPPGPTPPAPASAGGEAAGLAEEEMARRLALEQLRARRASATRERQSAVQAAVQKKFKQVQQRFVWNLATKIVGDTVLSETVVAPLISLALDNLRWIATWNDKPVKVPWFPIPGVELPPLSVGEKLVVVFLDIMLLPLMIISNPFFLPILVVAVIATEGCGAVQEHLGIDLCGFIGSFIQTIISVVS